MRVPPPLPFRQLATPALSALAALLVAVAPDGLDAFHEATSELNLKSFGQLTGRIEPLITVN